MNVAPVTQCQADTNFIQVPPIISVRNTIEKNTSRASLQTFPLVNADFLKKLEVTMGPTRVGANAIIATQLDHLQGINKPAVISDHLPVRFKVEFRKDLPAISVTSWNMLADVHRNNNYENIKVDTLTQSLFADKRLEYFSGRGSTSKTWYFSDLATELAKSELFSDSVMLQHFYTGTKTGKETFINFLQNH